MSFIGTQVKCKACVKTVYPLEQISADGIAYHKSCFKCSHCKGTLKVLISLFQEVVVGDFEGAYQFVSESYSSELFVRVQLGSRCFCQVHMSLKSPVYLSYLYFHVIGSIFCS